MNLQLAREKSTIKHRSSYVSHPGQNVVCAQPSVSHEEDEIQNSNFEYGSSWPAGEEPDENDRKPAAKRIKRSQKMRLRVGLKMSKKMKPHLALGRQEKL